MTFISQATSAGCHLYWCHFEDCLALLKELHLSFLEATVVSYNASMSCCEKAKQWPSALGLLREVEMLMLQADLISYSAIWCNSCVVNCLVMPCLYRSGKPVVENMCGTLVYNGIYTNGEYHAMPPHARARTQLA